MASRSSFLLAVAGVVPFVGVGVCAVELEPLAFALGERAAQALPGASEPVVAARSFETSRGGLVDVPRALPESSARSSSRRVRSTRRSRPPALHVGADRVLQVANAGARPTGVSVPAVTGRPAGIVVGGVTAMGVGAADGDVLTHVDGLPVSSPGEVVAMVLSARARRQPSMRARLYRGLQPYDVVVDMPYLEAPVVEPRRVASL